MNSYFVDYHWKDGIPYGLHPTPSSEKEALSYKIIMDPYRKRISIESYLYGAFNKIIYDSFLLDFRKLNPQEQLAWQKETIHETPQETISLIRNMEDRIILIEKQFFEEERCRECRIFSMHGIHLSTHRMSLDEVILYDANEHVVLRKPFSKLK